MSILPTISIIVSHTGLQASNCITFDIFLLQQYASSMVMKLQLSIQEVNTNLEDISQQVSHSFALRNPPPQRESR